MAHLTAWIHPLQACQCCCMTLCQTGWFVLTQTHTHIHPHAHTHLHDVVLGKSIVGGQSGEVPVQRLGSAHSPPGLLQQAKRKKRHTLLEVGAGMSDRPSSGEQVPAATIGWSKHQQFGQVCITSVVQHSPHTCKPLCSGRAPLQDTRCFHRCRTFLQRNRRLVCSRDSNMHTLGARLLVG